MLCRNRHEVQVQTPFLLHKLDDLFGQLEFELF